MHFLLDACLPRDFIPVIRSYKHDVTDVRDIGMSRADDPDIAAHAQRNMLALLTEDWGFGDIRAYPPTNYHGLVVFETVDNSTDEKVAALRNLLDRDDVISALPGRLAIVTATRIRLRPPM